MIFPHASLSLNVVVLPPVFFQLEGDHQDNADTYKNRNPYAQQRKEIG